MLETVTSTEAAARCVCSPAAAAAAGRAGTASQPSSLSPSTHSGRLAAWAGEVREGDVVKLSVVNQVRRRGGEGEGGREEEEGGGEGVREEVTLRQHLDTTKGSWRMAPGVSAESRRTRGGTTVSKSTSDAELLFRGSRGRLLGVPVISPKSLAAHKSCF